MDDLISRQAAITIPVTPKEDREYQTFNLDDAYEQAWDDLQKRIEQLPSAQPEYDLSGYSDKLWKAAYERGKKDGQSEIVRCRECKWHDGVRCFRWNSTIITGFDDFCSNGERRQDG